MSTKFWPVLHSLGKGQVHPGESSGVGLLRWRQSLQHEIGGRLLRKNVSVTKQRLTSFAGTEKKLEASRATSFFFIAVSRQSHIVRNDVTPGGHSKLKTHNAVFWQPLENDFDSNGWTFKGQGTFGSWTRCCVLVSDFKFVIFFPGCPCPFCIVITQ